MDPRAAQREIQRLTELINQHNQLYYQEARPNISDYAFDRLLAELQALENRFPQYRLPDSPTQILGETPTQDFATVYHEAPMLSLSNTYSADEVAQFVQRVQKQLPNESVTFFCELKFDGVAVSLVYEAGKLMRVVTRGDGLKGDDITQNALYIQHMPQVLQHPAIPPKLEARGEVFMTRSAFEKLNQDRIAQGAEPLANPRNATAGTLKTRKLQRGPARTLDCYLYSLRVPGWDLHTHAEGIALLEQWGFNVSPTYRPCTALAEILDYIDHWQQARKELEVGIDGIVIKVNQLAQQDQLRCTAKSPRWAIAYKYAPTHVTTVLQDVAYRVGRTGVITPVAHLAPILLEGTVVKKASLHNAAEIARLQLHLGDTVFIEKRGDIIPKITGVQPTARSPDRKPVPIPTHCPACSTPLVRPRTQGVHHCPNRPGCTPQKKAMLTHFVHKKAMDIQAIGEKTVDRLFEEKLVQTPADLYILREEDFYPLAGFRELAIQHILQGIAASRQQPFARVLFALGIRHIGSVVASKLADHCGSMDQVAQASVEDLMAIPMIGLHMAQSIQMYFQTLDNRQLVDALKKAGLRMHTAPPQLPPTHQPLAGKTFVISGTFKNFDREALRQQLVAQGGQVVSSVSAKLDYLIAGRKAGPAKLDQAAKWGITILDEPTLTNLLAC